MRNRRGVAAVEFAMTFPLLALVLLATIEFGWYFTEQQKVASIAYDAVRAASHRPTQAAAMARAEFVAGALLDEIGVNCDGGCQIEADALNVGGVPLVELNITVQYAQLTGILPSGSGLTAMMGFERPDTIRARALMPVVGP